MATALLERAIAAGAAVIDEDARRVRVSVSSETPYLRASYFGLDDPWLEVLGHKPSEVDLSRLATRGAPVLYSHNTRDRGAHVGVVERAWLDGGRLYADVRLSARDDVADLWRDIADGIVSNVSVGYSILERRLVRTGKEGPDEYRVTKWAPAEISFVAVPADHTVGVGRSAQASDVESTRPAASRRQAAMDEDENQGTGSEGETAQADAAPNER
jgi:phage head maturation protease